MSDKDPSRLKPNRPRLALHVPEPAFRPGDTPDFSSLKIPAAGTYPYVCTFPGHFAAGMSHSQNS